jgi:DNA-damage-inducible protein J
MTTAFNIFLRQSIREGSIPFPVTINTPNATTIAAMLEAERIAHDPTVKRYSDVEEALKELKS